MPARNPVKGSVQPITARLSATERRAAQAATLSTRQAELKQEAAERRSAREVFDGSSAPATPSRKRRSPAA